MGLSPLVPIAGAALGSLANKTLDRLTNGPSFLDTLRESFSKGDAAPPAGNQTTNVIPSAEEQAAKFETLVRLLRQRFSAAGVDTSVPIELKGDGRGRVIVDDPHPDRVAIEQILASDPNLSARFLDLSSVFARARELQGSLDPLGDGDFRLRLDERGACVSYE